MSFRINLNNVGQNSQNQYMKYEADMEEYQLKIDSLLEMIESEFTIKGYEIDFQLAYSKCHEICLNRMAKELYMGVTKLLTKIITSYQESLIKCSQGEFLTNLTQIYQFFSEKMIQISDTLSYLERVKQKYNSFNEEPVLFMGHQIFYQLVIFEGNLKNKIMNVLKAEYLQIRKGNVSNLENFILFFKILIEKKYGATFFEIDILPLLKSEAKEFYEKYSLEFKTSIGNIENKAEVLLAIKNYIDKAISFLDIEERILNIIDEKPVILNIAMDNLIISHFELLFKKGAKKFFNQNDTSSFCLFYNLIFNHHVQNIDSNINQFYTFFSEMLQKCLNKLSNTFVTFKQNQTVEYFNFLQYVEALCGLKQKCTNFVKASMNNNEKVEHIIKNLFEKQINQNSQFLYSFVKLVHDEIKLNQKLRSNAKIKDFADKFFTIFKLINDKDLFENEYRKCLSKRLIRNASMIKEMEVDFYKIMKKESGSSYVKKIENMMHDIFYSQTINFDFKLYNKKNNIELGLDFYIKVVSQDNWPLEKHLILNFNSEQNKNKELNSENLKIKGMPESLSKCIKEFTSFYYGKFTNRFISFVPELSWAELFVRINAKTYTFIVSTQQLILLMLFNSKKEYELKQLKELTDFSDDKLIEIYQPLIKNNVLILKNSSLCLNMNFTNNESKLNLNYKCKDKTKAKEEEKKDKEVSHFILEDRKYQIDASLIHVLKKYKKLSFDELKNKVTVEVKNYFIPEIHLLKQRLENLIDRNFIERDENNPDIYIYIA